MSPVHDMIKTAIKVLLSIIQIVCKGVPAASLRLALGIMITMNDCAHREFHVNLHVDYNAIMAAGSSSVAWTYFVSFFAALADRAEGGLEAWERCLILLNLLGIPAAVLMYLYRKRANANGPAKARSIAGTLEEPLLDA